MPHTIFVPAPSSCGLTGWSEPMGQRVDFTSEAFFRDPAATIDGFAHPRRVVATRFPIVGKVWVTTTYDATARVLKDSATVHAAQGGRRRRRAALVDADVRRGDRQQHADDGRAGSHPPARHRRRSLPPPRGCRHGAAHSQPSRTISRTSCSPTGTPADLVARYAQILPLAVICELLGLPQADRPTIHRLGQHDGAVHRHVRLSAHDRHDREDEALFRGALAARARSRAARD